MIIICILQCPKRTGNNGVKLSHTFQVQKKLQNSNNIYFLQDLDIETKKHTSKKT